MTSGIHPTSAHTVLPLFDFLPYPISHHRSLSPGNSLSVQWLGFCVFTPEGLGSIPSRGLRSHKSKKKKRIYSVLLLMLCPHRSHYIHLSFLRSLGAPEGRLKSQREFYLPVKPLLLSAWNLTQYRHLVTDCKIEIGGAITCTVLCIGSKLYAQQLCMLLC